MELITIASIVSIIQIVDESRSLKNELKRVIRSRLDLAKLWIAPLEEKKIEISKEQNVAIQNALKDLLHRIDVTKRRVAVYAAFKAKNDVEKIESAFARFRDTVESIQSLKDLVMKTDVGLLDIFQDFTDYSELIPLQLNELYKVYYDVRMVRWNLDEISKYKLAAVQGRYPRSNLDDLEKKEEEQEKILTTLSKEVMKIDAWFCDPPNSFFLDTFIKDIIDFKITLIQNHQLRIELAKVDDTDIPFPQPRLLKMK
jgi:DNA polymerase III epsilon subunit-like protein